MATSFLPSQSKHYGAGGQFEPRGKDARIAAQNIYIHISHCYWVVFVIESHTAVFRIFFSVLINRFWTRTMPYLKMLLLMRTERYQFWWIMDFDYLYLVNNIASVSVGWWRNLNIIFANVWHTLKHMESTGTNHIWKGKWAEFSLETSGGWA